MVTYMSLMASALSFSSLVSGVYLPRHLTSRDAEPTCSGKAQGTTFTYSSGSTYSVLCGYDYAGGDLRSFQASTFQDCIVACDSESSCLTLSFANGVCYLKSQVTSAVSNTDIWAAKKQNAKAGLSCVDKADDGKTYTASTGTFNIICGREYGGGDLTSTSTATFEACIEACAANSMCIDVSYVNGACYLKQTLNTLIDASYVWTAQLVNAQTSTTTQALTCQSGESNGKTYTAKNGGSYTVECGIDYAGGDFSSLSSTTFESCMDACDAAPTCVDVSWVYGACYMKDVLNAGSAVDYVWTGRRTTAAQSSSLLSSTPTISSSALSSSSVSSTITPTPVITSSSSTASTATTSSTTTSSAASSIATDFCLKVVTPNLSITGSYIANLGTGENLVVGFISGWPVPRFKLDQTGLWSTLSGDLITINGLVGTNINIRTYSAAAVLANPTTYPSNSCSLAADNTLQCTSSTGSYTWSAFAMYSTYMSLRETVVPVTDTKVQIIKLGAVAGAQCPSTI